MSETTTQTVRDEHAAAPAPAAIRQVAPLQGVTRVSVSEKCGHALNPRYFWLTYEFTLELECGHSQVRARYVLDHRPHEFDKLNPPLPSRVRCALCPPKPTTRTGTRKTAPLPRFDPVVGALVAATCKASPAHEEKLLSWVSRHGRYVPDPPLRARAYGSAALVAIESYLPDTKNPYALDVRTALEAWSHDPTPATHAAVRGAARRLYGSQERHGDRYAHCGILSAAKLASPAPHNVRAALTCLTWDSETRSAFFNRLWSLRNEHDRQRGGETAAFLDDDADGVVEHATLADELGAQLTDAVDNDQPVIAEKHVPLVEAMLDAYQHAMEHGDRPESPDDLHAEVATS